jgi:hypothetical protein
VDKNKRIETKPMDAHKYYSTEIEPSVSKLPDSDRLLLIEALFTGMIKAMGAYYDVVYANMAPQYVQREADGIKQMISKRLSEIIIPYSGTVTLEANPMEPTDRLFVMDAVLDFDKLMKTVSKTK